MNGEQQPPGGYPPQQGGGYPPQQGGGNPPQQGGYPPQQGGGNPPQQGGYPPQQGGGYPPQQGGGYPPQQGGYPPQQGGGYPPPQGGYPPGGEMKPSGTPKVMGILMIVFSSLGLIASAFGLIASSSPQELPLDLLETIRKYDRLMAGSGLLVSALHLVAGIFCVGFRSKGPMLANLYVGLALVWAVMRLVLYYSWVAPKLKEFAGPIGEAVSAGAGIGVVAGTVFVAIWPILVLILMNGAKAKEACVR